MQDIVKSPCIGVCQYAEISEKDIERVCRGCGRTAEEIEEWFTASQTRKREIIKACEKRKVE